MHKKYILLDSEESFSSKHSEIMDILGLPDNEGNSFYASSATVNNPDHVEFGKFIMPVVMSGVWKTSQHFESSALIDFDPDWLITE
jgi:hypothetical protein